LPSTATRVAQEVAEITARERLLLAVEEIVGDPNRFLSGGYFRYGNPGHTFDKITLHAISRLATGEAISDPLFGARPVHWMG
jgi:hypothetical protein